MASNSSDQERVPFQVSPSHLILALLSPPGHPQGSSESTLIDGHFEGSSAENHAHLGTGKEFIKGGRCTYMCFTTTCTDVDWCDVAWVTIDMLPDIALLEVFYFYMDEEQIEAWHTLVHVCRQWRSIVFESPHRLNLRIYWPFHIPVKGMLDVWPPLPIVMKLRSHQPWTMDNTVVGLEHNDRVCDLDLFYSPGPRLDRVLAEMRRPFPVLKHLRLRYLRSRSERNFYKAAPVDPDSFLGGSAPRLQTLSLHSVPFPGLPKLLLSATNLISLRLLTIPRSGYIPPEAMVTCLAALTRLTTLVIGFESPRFHPGREIRHSPLPTRALLPVLTKLGFFGTGEYWESLVARIDAPLLDNLGITFFPEPVLHTPHDSPQLTQFINRTPKFKAHYEARVVFSYWGVSVILPQTCGGTLRLGISFNSDRNLSSLAQFCSSSLPRALITAVEHFYILVDKDSFPYWRDESRTANGWQF
jgi:hypothetical protein